MSESTLDGQHIYSSLGDDPDLGELVELFVSEMPDRVSTLQGQLQQADWEQLRRTAHQLKGAAGSYGFDQLTPYAAQLEHLCQNISQEAEIRSQAEELISMCCKVRAGVPE